MLSSRVLAYTPDNQAANRLAGRLIDNEIQGFFFFSVSF